MRKREMKEDIKMIWCIISVLTLLFLVLPAVSSHIEIIDMGHYYDGISRLGYVDYQNIANHNVSGAILVSIDGDVVAGKILDMPIQFVACFPCSPMKTLESALNKTEEDHTIAVHILSMNSSLERIYEYHAADWWADQEGKIESELEEEEWLKCWQGCEE